MQPKKILIVAPGPLLLDHGWHIRTYQLVQHFEKMGFIPEIFILYPKEWGPLPDEWLGLTREYNLRGIVYYKVLKGYYPSLKTFLAINEIKREYEFILFRFEKLAFQSLFFLIGKKIIIDYTDNHLARVSPMFYFYLHHVQHIPFDDRFSQFHLIPFHLFQ